VEEFLIGLAIFLVGRHLGFRSGFFNGINEILDTLKNNGWEVEEDGHGNYRYRRMYGDHWYKSRAEDSKS